MTPTEQLRALNTDHHKRMASDAGARRNTERDGEIRRLDMESRRAICGAMLGAESRYNLRGRKTVLELGAGYGGDIPYLLDYFGLSHYQGIEVVPEVAEASGGLRIAQGSFEDIAEKQSIHMKAYGFIYSRHVMEHVLDVPRAMKALKTLLAPGGVIGAVTPHYFPDPEPAHVTQLNVAQWMQAYEDHGFRVVYAMERAFACPEAHIVAIYEGDFDPSL